MLPHLAIKHIEKRFPVEYRGMVDGQHVFQAQLFNYGLRSQIGQFVWNYFAEHIHIRLYFIATALVRENINPLH
jgi:hypothetical protein